MARVYKIGKDPQGLLKKPPTYFFHSYKPAESPRPEPEKKPPEKLNTRDYDSFVNAEQQPADETAVYGVTSTPPEKVVRPDSEHLDETDRMMLKAFGGDAEEQTATKRKKRRGENPPRSTVQVDEDIRSMYDAQEEQDSSEEKPGTVGEVDHGPLNIEDDGDQEENPYEMLDNDDEEVEYPEEQESEEYTDPEDVQRFIHRFKTRARVDLLLGLGALVVFCILFYIESFSFMPMLPRPAFLKPENSRLVLTLVDIQMLVIAAALIYEGFIDGTKALFTGKPNGNTVTVCVLLICLIHDIVMCFLSDASNLTLYSSVGAFFAVLSAFHSAMDNRRNVCTFNVLSSDDEKYIAQRTDGSDGELRELGEFLPENPDMFSLKKTDFVEDTVKSIKTPAKSEQNHRIIIPLSIGLSLVYAAVIYFISSDVNRAVNAFTVMSLLTLPLSALIYISLPYLLESLRISRRGCAMIGSGSFEEYSMASVVSFNDTEVMPSRGIKVTSVRTYGDHRIDHTILYAARIFKTVGGPLSSVFESCIKNAVDDIQPVEITSIEPDGISAVIDGKEVYIGKKSFMLAYNFGFVKDAVDDSFEGSIGRIMYMTFGDNIAAKFYIKYSIYKGFEKILANLSKAGICVGVKTCDPNIDEALLNKLLHRKEYPVRIIKSETPLPADEVSSRAPAGMVCTTGAFNLLRTFLSCDKVAKNVTLNVGVKFISMFVAFAIIVFLSIVNGGNISAVTPQFIVLYQLLWLMPAVATAIFG